MNEKRIWRIFANLPIVITLLGLLLASGCSQKAAKSPEPESKQQAQQPNDYLQAKPEVIQRWRDMKFGLFVHWGPVSLKGTEISWSRKGPRPGRTDTETGSIPIEEYDNLYKQFNPVKFDAQEWVQIAKDAGMKYLVFTSKHHDGFSMFDSKLTDYDIMASPYGKDICKQLAEACHKQGLQLGWYYSPRDWYHPDFATQHHQKYLDFYIGQLRELCSNYGKVDILWFDGLDSPRQLWGETPKDSFRMLRSLQPHIVLNDRGGLPGDFGTPEQEIGSFKIDRPWETCMTICRQWAWKPNDQMKSLEQCIQTLVRVVGGDGNFLFNVGPMPDGRVESRQVERLREMGQWLKKYGQSIYDTRGGPFKPGTWGASTHKGKRIYVHVLNWQGESLQLPAIDRQIVSSSLLTGGSVNLKQTKDGITVTIPKQYHQNIDTIVMLELDGPAGEIAPVNVVSAWPAQQKEVYTSKTAKSLEPETKQQRDKRMAWWRQARFGMFIHWGVYAVPAGTYKGERIPNIGEWIMHSAKIPIPEYEQFAKQFNPVKFNADEWVQLAKKAGMKYIVITSKHHDGFCLWDSKVSDYDIIDAAPFKRDILKELAEACRKHNIKFCFYHSIMDWHHPDAKGENFPNYREQYMKPQLKELVANYGPLGVLWFDGEWIEEWTEPQGKDLYNFVRDLQPNIIINNRVGKGRKGMDGFSKSEEHAGDFGTPEQEIPATGVPGVDWETCMTMNNTWGYKSYDHNWKSTEDLLRKLVDIASKGGNFLLNVGPTAEGLIPPPSVERLLTMGKWMDKNSESIYETTASPLGKVPWGRCTAKPGKLYLHVFDWPKDGNLEVRGQGIDKVKKAYLLADKKRAKLPILGEHLDVFTILLPAKAPDPIDTVVVLEIKD